MDFFRQIKKGWNKIINTGVTDELADLQIIRIKVVNGSIVLLTLIQFLLIYIRFLDKTGFSLLNVLNFCIALLAIPVLYFNSKRKYRTAVTIFFVGILSLITFICWFHASHGGDTNTEIILLASSVFCVLLFDGWLKYALFFLIFGCYVFVVSTRIYIQTDHIQFNRNNLLNPALAFTTLFVLTSLYRVAYDKLQKTVLAKNEELNKQKEQIGLQAKKLQEINNQKDKLFSIISHDIRNPLNSLNGLMTLIGKEWITEQDFKQQLPGLSKNLHAISDLLNNLLLWSRSQMMGETHQQEDFDISVLAKSTVESVESQAIQKKITIENKISEAQLVHADKNMMAVVLRNLLTNAIKFSHAQQRILLTATSTGGLLRVCVADTGTGIAAEKIIDLFELNSISTSGTLQEKGTGLGLMLCKDFVEKNGGKIWVESQLGKGSSFYFTIPLKN
jgi:signal transduction histidine kinase